MNFEAELARLAPLAIDVVSAQSQVVYGRVGNTVAVPVLQAAGLRVAALPSVLLGNTPHYPTMHGGAVREEWFGGWLQDLEARGALAALRAVLVGYLGSAGQARLLADWLGPLRRRLPGLQVQVDPVIGDRDVGVYVAPGLVEAWRGLVPLAAGLTPNGFELATLAGRPTDSPEEVVAAARSLLGGHARWVAVTSAAPGSWPAGRMRLALVTQEDAQWIEHRRVAAAAKGTGDLFAASLLARRLAGTPLAAAVRAAAEEVVEALELTAAAGCGELLVAGIPALR